MRLLCIRSAFNYTDLAHASLLLTCFIQSLTDTHTYIRKQNPRVISFCKIICNEHLKKIKSRFVFFSLFFNSNATYFV